jgi:hypothetical protein
MALKGLDGQSARWLVAESDEQLGQSATARLIAETGGNPLALRELPAQLSSKQLRPWSFGLEPLPITRVIEEAFGRRNGSLPRTVKTPF